MCICWKNTVKIKNHKQNENPNRKIEKKKFTKKNRSRFFPKDTQKYEEKEKSNQI